jgi:hypothetical protein
LSYLSALSKGALILMIHVCDIGLTHIQIWDPREKNVVQRIPVHTSDGSSASGRGDFDTSMGSPPRSYAAAVACLTCLAGDEGTGGVGGGGLGYVVSGGSESAVKVYNLLIYIMSPLYSY